VIKGTVHIAKRRPAFSAIERAADDRVAAGR
jgi:hypothetical protein